MNSLNRPPNANKEMREDYQVKIQRRAFVWSMGLEFITLREESNAEETFAIFANFCKFAKF